jgi:hypothetical protein
VISDAFFKGSIASHAADLQRIAADTDLDVVWDNACKI